MTKKYITIGIIVLILGTTFFYLKQEEKRELDMDLSDLEKIEQDKRIAEYKEKYAHFFDDWKIKDGGFCVSGYIKDEKTFEKLKEECSSYLISPDGNYKVSGMYIGGLEDMGEKSFLRALSHEENEALYILYDDKWNRYLSEKKEEEKIIQRANFEELLKLIR
jgi:hypothetical protein